MPTVSWGPDASFVKRWMRPTVAKALIKGGGVSMTENGSAPSLSLDRALSPSCPLCPYTPAAAGQTAQQSKRVPQP